MDLINSIYGKAVSENERSLNFWEEYLKNLQTLDFSLFSEQLTVPVMVPVGSRIVFRGHLKHTNEVTVALGAGYFAKCSVKQAEILRRHRIKDAQSKVVSFNKEKEYLESQIFFAKQNMYNYGGQEIIEEYSEEEDKIWREKHRKNMKHYKNKSQNNNQPPDNITDEELWDKLEELELKEELEGELEKNNNINMNIDNRPVFLNNNNNILPYIFNAKQESNDIVDTSKDIKLVVNNESIDKSLNKDKSDTLTKFDLLQQVLNKQNELGERLQKIKKREESIKITENNLISKLDEMEQIEELEDEMDRLDDIIQSEGGEYLEQSDEKVPAQQIKRGVMFADENDSETLEITFKHSAISPSSKPYNPEEGIQKPSDVYLAFKSLFSEDKPSILKKNKTSKDFRQPIKLGTQENEGNYNIENKIDNSNVIVIKDVIERVDANTKMDSNIGAKPTSLFKKKRMQNKSKASNYQ